MVTKFCPAGTKHLLTEVSFGGLLHMLHQLGRECQNKVIITLMFVLELVTPNLVLRVHPSEMVPRLTCRRLPTG